MKQKFLQTKTISPCRAWPGIRSYNMPARPRPSPGWHLIFFLSFFLLTSPALANEKVLDIQRVVSPKGIEAWLVEDRSVPVISMSFAFKGGMAFEDPVKPGTSRLVSILLDEGAGDMDSQTFQKELADHAIDMGFDIGRDAFRGSLRTLTENREKAFSLLKLALTQPRFDADAIARMKETNIATIKHNLSDPDWLAQRVFNGMVFENHPYARPGYGTLPSMERITADDLRNFVKQQFSRNLLKISVAGDISAAELGEILDATFADLPNDAQLSSVPQAALQRKSETILYSFDVPQTFIMMGHEGIDHKDPDWHAAQLVMYTLGGGGFESRLMKSVREERGLTYGISASLNVMDHATLVQTDTSTANKSAGEVIELIKGEWQKMADEGPLPEEISDAKAYLTGALPLGLTSTSKIANVMTEIQLDDRGIDYINRRNDLLSAVTLEDAKRAAGRLFKADDLTTVVVGKPEGIKNTLAIPAPPDMELPPSHD